MAKTVEQASILTDKMSKTVIVDRVYQGVAVNGAQILRSGQRRGIARGLKAMIKRRSANEATVGHMKTDGRLDRNPMKGVLGDALHAMQCRPQDPAPDEEALASLLLRPLNMER